MRGIELSHGRGVEERDAFSGFRRSGLRMEIDTGFTRSRRVRVDDEDGVQRSQSTSTASGVLTRRTCFGGVRKEKAIKSSG